MLFFINPITSLVDSLSQEKALTKAYLGLSETMAKPKPITNSVGEFRFYYNRFLSYLIWHLENTIASVEQANVQMESKTTIPESTPANAPIEIDVNIPREVDIENPTDIGVEEQISEEKATAPTEEALVVDGAQTSSTSQTPEIEVGETEDSSDWPIPDNQPTPNNNSKLSTEEGIAILLECETKLQLMSKKKEIGEELVKKAWDAMTLVQKNYIKTNNRKPRQFNLAQRIGSHLPLGYKTYSDGFNKAEVQRTKKKYAYMTQYGERYIISRQPIPKEHDISTESLTKAVSLLLKMINSQEKQELQQ